MEPHPALDARQARHLDRVRGLGYAPAAVGAARGARQRHAGTGLRARRRALPGRAARRRGSIARADRNHRVASRHERQGIPDRRGRGLRNRAARRHLHGSRAHRARLAFGRNARRVLRRGRRCTRIEARRQQDRARARHRRHASRGADGGAIRRDGEAHARRALVAKRALRRAAPRSAGSSTS